MLAIQTQPPDDRNHRCAPPNLVLINHEDGGVVGYMGHLPTCLKDLVKSDPGYLWVSGRLLSVAVDGPVVGM